MRFLAVLAAVVLPLIAYYPVYQDREATIRNLDEQLHQVETKVEQAHAAQRKLSQFHEEVQRLNVEVAKLRTILPPNPALDEVHGIVDAVAETSGVRIGEFQPRQPIRHDYVEVPIETTAEGTIDALASFFGTLRNKTQILDVSKVTLEKVDSAQWRAKFLMSAFALPD